MKNIRYGLIIAFTLLTYSSVMSYLSEPNYKLIQNNDVQINNIVRIKPYPHGFPNEVLLALVIERNDSLILAKVFKTYYTKTLEYGINSNEFKVIAEGTFYHKFESVIGQTLMRLHLMFCVVFGIIAIIFTILSKIHQSK